MKNNAFIRTTMKEPTKIVRLEFEVPWDWEPSKLACWVDCPFSVCTELGHECRAQSNDLCPFKRTMKDNCNTYLKEV